MSMMMHPDAAPPGPGFDPGGGATPAPPPDAATLQALMAGLQGGPPGPDLGAGLPPGGPPPGLAGLGGPPGLGDPGAGGNPDDTQPMSAVDHIRQAMKHLMMAMTQQEDDQMGHGITKGMTALQGLLAGDAKQPRGG